MIHINELVCFTKKGLIFTKNFFYFFQKKMAPVLRNGSPLEFDSLSAVFA